MSATPQQWLWTAQRFCEMAERGEEAKWLTVALLCLHAARHGVPPDYWEVLRTWEKP